MRNNNGAIIRKITGRTLRTNIKRNFFITVAIALTAFMIASVFSVGMGIYRNMMIFPFRLEGTRTHMGIMGLDAQQLETLRNANDVRHIAFNTPSTDPVGDMMLPGFDEGVTMIYVDRTSWEQFQTPTFTNVRGHYATADNGIMLSRNKLNIMGIENPYVGMEIPLDFTIRGSEAILHETFTLSAIYSELVSVQPGAMTPVFVSQAFAQRHGRYNPDEFTVNVIFRSQRHAYDHARRLIGTLNLRDNQHYAIHPAVIHNMYINAAAMVLPMASIVAFIMLVGFLLIYNVMFVSVSKDVRFYGLLKTLGTTPRQLRRVVNGQVLRLCFIGLPLGLGAAAMASLAIVPASLSDSDAMVSFSPLIYVGGAVFTLLTAYLSAFTSAKKAARVSPIEAIRYSGEAGARLKARTSAKGKPWRMAWRNIFRGKKQATVVLISLFLGLAVFISVMAIVFGLDIEGELNAWHNHDFAVNATAFGSLEPGIVHEIAAIPGVTQIDKLTLTGGSIPSAVIPAIENTIPPRPAQVAAGSIRGISTAWLLEVDPYLDIDIAAFERGEIALLESMALRWHWPDTIPGLIGNNLLSVGDIVDIELEAFTAKDVQIAGHTYNLRTGSSIWMSYAPISIIMSYTFLQQHVEGVIIDSLGINVQAGMDTQVDAALRTILGQNGSIRSRYEARQQMEDARLMMFVLGVGVSAILGLIGVFNFINVISVGLLVRRREFAALESVGMSKKQMRAMLRWEGAVYWMISIAASLTAGSAIAYGFYALLHRASPIQFPAFNYPLLPALAAYVIIVIICSVVPELAYRSMSKMTLVERLREAE